MTGLNRVTDFGLNSAQLADKATRFQNAWIDVKQDYGAKGDNTFHTIASVFPSVTLAQVQALNSNATLSNSADWYALQTAINAGGNLFIPAGTYITDLPLQNNSNINIVAVVGATVIQNNGSGHNFIVNHGCTMFGININGNYQAGSSGSALFLNTAGKFTQCTFGGSTRYGIEFSSTATIVSCHFNECTVQYNIMGGVYSYSDGPDQKNVVQFFQCYVVHNGLTSTGGELSDATPTSGHGYFINGGIDWAVIGGVSEYNSGAGIYLQSRSDYGVYGFSAMGVHLESNKYCNGYINAQGVMNDVIIHGMYYYTMSSVLSMPSTLTNQTQRFIVVGYNNLNYSSIDKTYDDSTIKTQLMNGKHSLKLGGEFETITPYKGYTNHIVSGDSNAGGYNVIRCDSTLGSNYTEPTGLATFIDPRETYRVTYEYFYTKSSSSSASLSFLQLDSNKNGLGGTISYGLASGGVWYTQEALITPSQLNTSARYLQINPNISGTLASGDVLLIRRVLIQRLDSSSAVLSGATSNRPAWVVPGYQYFDTTLSKPVWCKTTGSTCTWVDATGTTV